MDWISDHFQIVILVVLAFGSMVKTIIEKAAKKRSEEPWDGEMEGGDDDWTPAPTRQPSVPPPLQRNSNPPPVPSRGTPPPVPSAGLESAREAATALKHQQDLAERLRQIRANKATTTGGAGVTRARVASKGQMKSISTSPLPLRSRLKNPTEVRQAMVLREILGPPVGLR